MLYISQFTFWSADNTLIFCVYSFNKYDNVNFFIKFSTNVNISGFYKNKDFNKKSLGLLTDILDLISIKLDGPKKSVGQAHNNI